MPLPSEHEHPADPDDTFMLREERHLSAPAADAIEQFGLMAPEDQEHFVELAGESAARTVETSPRDAWNRDVRLLDFLARYARLDEDDKAMCVREAAGVIADREVLAAADEPRLDGAVVIDGGDPTDVLSGGA